MLLSIGFHVGLAVMVAAMLVKPSGLSGGIQVYLAGGGALAEGTGKGRLPASRPARAPSGNALPTQPSVTHKTPRPNTALRRRPHPDVDRHRNPHPDTANQRHVSNHHPRKQPTVHQVHPLPSKSAVPVQQPKELSRHVASVKKAARSMENKKRVARREHTAKHVSSFPVGHTPHLPGSSQATPIRPHTGAGHHASAGPEGTGSHGGHGSSTGRGPGKGHRGPNLGSYYATVLARIQAAKHYPWVAQRRSMQGAARIAFRLSSTGRLLWARIARSSGFTILDKAALAAVRNAAPYPKFPGRKDEMPASMAVNVDFTLK